MGRPVVGDGPLVGTVRMELAPAWVRERVVEPRAGVRVAVESVWGRTTARARAPV